jgi:hypothetical protein
MRLFLSVSQIEFRKRGDGSGGVCGSQLAQKSRLSPIGIRGSNTRCNLFLQNLGVM